MIEKPFKFRWDHEIAGAFVLIVVLLAAVLVLVTGRLQGWFEKQSWYEVVLPREGVEGIRAGSEVRILGSRAGRVRSVELRRAGGETKLRGVWEVEPDEIDLVAVLEVRGDRSVFVGAESRAVVRKDLAGFGASYVEITRGSSKREEGDRRLPLTRETDVTNEVTAIVRELQEAMLPAVEQVGEAYLAVESLATVLADPGGDFQKAMASLQEVMSAVNRGDGALGMLLREEQPAEDLEVTLAEMRKAVSVLREVLDDFEEGEGAAGLLFRDEEVREQVKSAVAHTEETAAGLPATVRATRATVAEIQQAAEGLQEGLKEYEYVAEALQRHWILRRFVVRDGEETGDKSLRERVAAKEGNCAAAPELARKPRGVGGPR